MKQILFIFLFILMFASVVALDACSDTNEIDSDEIPCVGITNPISCSGNVSVINLNTSTQTNLTTTLIGLNQYNFTFNFSSNSYQVNDCANNTATIIVGDFPRDDLWKTAIIIGLVGLSLLLFVLGYYSFSEQSWFLKSIFYISSILIGVIIISSSNILSKVSSISNLTSLSVIISSILAFVFVSYLFIIYTIHILTILKNSKKSKEEDIE